MPSPDSDSKKIEKEFEISIPLENFNYSGTKDDGTREEGTSNFFGRTREKAKLLDHLVKGKNRSRSFLVAGYRGVGKTRFVKEVLNNYEKKGNKFIRVSVNLGNDGDLSSKSVLFNMVSLLSNQLEEKFLVRFFSILFENFIPRFLLVIVLSSLLLAAILSKSEGSVIKLFCGNEIDCYDFFFLWNFLPFLFLIVCWMLLRDGKISFCILSRWNAFVKLKTLQKEIYSATDSHFQVKSDFFDYGKKIVASPLTSNQIESKLKYILERLNTEVIFVFDELDKLSGSVADKKEVNPDLIKESKFRKLQVDSILGDLKNLITSSNARYIFIAGRDMYDAYLSEKGSSNSLYESLFNDHIYIPSLLTDRSNGEVYLLDSMIEAFVISNLIPKCWAERILYAKKIKCEEGNRPKMECDDDLSRLKLSDYVDLEKDKIINTVCTENRYLNEGKLTELIKDETEKLVDGKLLKEVYILKTLIHFLTLHSWGNCKRLFTLFESFVRKGEKGYELHLSTQDVQRLVLSSHLYILFHHNLSRMLMNADDKLVVSSFSVFHYILKYHGIGFSREHILRMYETINIHSSPELTRIVDIIIHNVLLNHVRRVRNSFYQYRFTFLHEKEIHFITTINDGESAAFNFSLNAMDAVKQHYKNLIAESKQAHADERYGHIPLASIHVIVGNFHFWEQSFDEASIHYGIALDMLEKNGGLTRVSIKVDLVLQMVEIYLKQGSAAERVGNYSAAAAIYLNAETLAKKCLRKLNDKISHRDDSKWDIFRQPEWARQFLNLKQSAIPYKHNDSLPVGDGTDVSIYRKAILLFFMERFCDAKSEFVKVIQYAEKEEDAERAYFLKGNAYLKAGFSVFLEYSAKLHEELEKQNRKKNINPEPKHLESEKRLEYLLKALIRNICDAFEGIEEFVLLNERDLLDELKKNEQEINVKAEAKGVMLRVIKLLNLSALSFVRGKLYSNAAISYLSMVMVWEAFLEVLPWEKNKDEYWLKAMEDETEIYKDLQDKIKKIRDIRKKSEIWIFEAQQKAFEYTGQNTGEAYHHFMKSVLERNLKKKQIEKKSFFGKKMQRNRILKNEYLLFQHYSLFGQVIAASIYWEEIAANNMTGEIEKNNNLILLKGVESKLLPYGIRHYSMMLWLKGRMYLSELLRKFRGNSRENPSGIVFQETLEVTAANAIVNLFRSSQYVIKTHGETSNMILPPLFIIYYNMWEVLFQLVDQEYKKTTSFEQAVYTVRFNLGNQLKKKDINDVSARVLDLFAVAQMALEQYKIVERMGDPSSSNRTSILRNKYYLDDDYEDNMFILDWSYCRFFAPSAMVHGKIIEYKMNLLKKKFEKIQYKLLTPGFSILNFKFKFKQR